MLKELTCSRLIRKLAGKLKLRWLLIGSFHPDPHKDYSLLSNTLHLNFLGSNVTSARRSCATVSTYHSILELYMKIFEVIVRNPHKAFNCPDGIFIFRTRLLLLWHEVWQQKSSHHPRAVRGFLSWYSSDFLIWSFCDFPANILASDLTYVTVSWHAWVWRNEWWTRRFSFLNPIEAWKSEHRKFLHTNRRSFSNLEPFFISF